MSSSLPSGGGGTFASQARLTNTLVPWVIVSVEGPSDCKAGSRRVLGGDVGFCGVGEARVHIVDCKAVLLIHQPGVGVSATLIVRDVGRENSSITRTTQKDSQEIEKNGRKVFGCISKSVTESGWQV